MFFILPDKWLEWESYFEDRHVHELPFYNYIFYNYLNLKQLHY